MNNENLYDKYGGFATINSIVVQFYDNLLENDDVSHFFENISMEKLIDHQTKFLCQVLGGPADYSGRELKDAHLPLKITEKDFGVVATVLRETLQTAGVEAQDLETIMGVVGGTKNQIVSA
jgi:hemoglobin